MRIKPIVRTLHLTLAVVAGVPLLVMSVTGALLVFPDPLDRAVHGDRVTDPADSSVKPASELIVAAQAVLPECDRVVRMQYPKAPGDTLVARTKEERTVVLDPATARVLRVVEVDGFDVHNFLVRLHVDLFAGKVGRWITGVTAVALILLCLTGLYLWWPRGWWAWHYLKVKLTSGRLRLNYDLHRASGLYSSAPLFVIAVTGATMAFQSFVTPAVYFLTGSSPKQPGPAKVVAATGPKKPLAVDEVVSVAKSHVPGAELCRLYPPKADDAPYRVFLLPAHDRQTRFEETRLVIDPYTGAILDEDGPRTMSAGDRAMRWLLPLHFGTFGGTTTRVIYVVVSICPVLLTATGFFVWRKRVRGRRASATVRGGDAEPTAPAVGANQAERCLTTWFWGSGESPMPGDQCEGSVFRAGGP